MSGWFWDGHVNAAVRWNTWDAGQRLEWFARRRHLWSGFVRQVERYRLADLAFKAVGVGSVGTFCCVGLFLSGDSEPLFLQVKEAKASVLEEHLPKSRYRQHGKRVVLGQRMMQAVSDIYLG